MYVCDCVGEILDYIRNNVAASDVLAEEIEGTIIIWL